MAKSAKHGGSRAGAGRPKGSRMRRSEALATKVIDGGNCPVDALIRLANDAEGQGDRREAISAWKAVLPFIYPRPKAVEVEPESAIELAGELVQAQRAAANPPTDGASDQQMKEIDRILDEMWEKAHPQ